MTRTIQRCYVLGAGFSKICGLPLASELTEQVFEHVCKGVDFRPDVAKGWMDILRHLYPSCDLKQTWPDFEDLITVLDEWERYRAAFEGTATRPGVLQPAHFKRVLLKHLGLLVCEKTAACPPESLKIIKHFVQAVSSRNEAIISFNWDLLLEVACKQLDLEVSYGGETTGGLQITKPHGSLNLAQMSQAEFDRASGAINVRNVYIDWQDSDIDVVVIRAEDPADAPNRIISPFKDTLLVEPTARKAYVSGWINLQWHRALQMVRATEEIVVIGYSLPNTDFRPRILLQLVRLNRHDQPRLILVDPKANEVAVQYRQYVSIPIELISQPWPEWFEDAER